MTLCHLFRPELWYTMGFNFFYCFQYKFQNIHQILDFINLLLWIFFIISWRYNRLHKLLLVASSWFFFVRNSSNIFNIYIFHLSLLIFRKTARKINVIFCYFQDISMSLFTLWFLFKNRKFNIKNLIKTKILFYINLFRFQIIFFSYD